MSKSCMDRMMFSSCREKVESKQVGHRTAVWATPPSNLALPSWQPGPMEQESQGLQAVSKPYWDAQLSSSAQGCQHGYGSQSRAPALPLGAPLCQESNGVIEVPKGQGGGPAPEQSADGFTFWQDSRNSSIVTTPSLFRSIFCIQAQYDGMAGTAAAPERAQHSLGLGPAVAGHSTLLPQPSPSTWQDQDGLFSPWLQHSPASSPVWGVFFCTTPGFGQPLALC